MRLSRLDYDKYDRCPTWGCGGWTYAHYEDPPCTASFASFFYERRGWRWKFTRCRECGVICFPAVTRWADPSYLLWRIRRKRLSD